MFITHGADPVTAGEKAIATIGKVNHAQADLMGFADTFSLLGVMLAIGAISVAFLKRAAGSCAGAH